METVTMGELRRRGGRLLDRVERGAALLVTRNGVAVAELHPAARRSPSAADLIARRRSLPLVDPRAWRRDVDAPHAFLRPGEPD